MKKILVVEDTEFNRDLMVQLLEDDYVIVLHSSLVSRGASGLHQPSGSTPADSFAYFRLAGKLLVDRRRSSKVARFVTHVSFVGPRSTRIGRHESRREFRQPCERPVVTR